MSRRECGRRIRPDLAGPLLELLADHEKQLAACFPAIRGSAEPHPTAIRCRKVLDPESADDVVRDDDVLVEAGADGDRQQRKIHHLPDSVHSHMEVDESHAITHQEGWILHQRERQGLPDQIASGECRGRGERGEREPNRNGVGQTAPTPLAAIAASRLAGAHNRSSPCRPDPGFPFRRLAIHRTTIEVRMTIPNAVPSATRWSPSRHDGIRRTTGRGRSNSRRSPAQEPRDREQHHEVHHRRNDHHCQDVWILEVLARNDSCRCDVPLARAGNTSTAVAKSVLNISIMLASLF